MVDLPIDIDSALQTEFNIANTHKTLAYGSVDPVLTFSRVVSGQWDNNTGIQIDSF
jgi:hypothetical protein